MNFEFMTIDTPLPPCMPSVSYTHQMCIRDRYYIDRLSCHIASTGKQYHSHAATIYKSAQEDAAKGKAAPKQGIPDYSCKEGESL